MIVDSGINVKAPIKGSTLHYTLIRGNDAYIKDFFALGGPHLGWFSLIDSIQHMHLQ